MHLYVNATDIDGIATSPRITLLFAELRRRHDLSARASGPEIIGLAAGKRNSDTIFALRSRDRGALRMFEPGHYPSKGWRMWVFVACVAGLGILGVALYFTTRTL